MGSPVESNWYDFEDRLDTYGHIAQHQCSWSIGDRFAAVSVSDHVVCGTEK